MRERIVVVAPGRGSYTKETLGYLKKHRPRVNNFVAKMDKYKSEANEPTISFLDDASIFENQLHTKGENASSLIYACSYADFTGLDFDKYEVVAVTGNSMGWYIALACAGALSEEGGFKVIDTMGSMMKNKIIGGQLIYSLVDENWHIDQKRMKQVFALMHSVIQEPDCEIYVSIYLGGYIVLGGNQAGLTKMQKQLQPVEHFPFQLINHAAFHTPMLKSVTSRAFDVLDPDLFRAPVLPLIDGRGAIWQPYSTNISELYRYTFEHQVQQPYDFTKAITVALKEFAPDKIVLLGPGNTLGGTIGQILVQEKWLNIKTKNDFSALQKTKPFLISLGLSS